MTPPAVGYGLRITGVVLAAGYLLALAAGSVLDVVVALALISLGRSMVTQSHAGPSLYSSCLVLLAGAGAIAAVRWESSALADIRGAQAVLGPTVSVGPSAAAFASAAGAIAGVIALALWSGHWSFRWGERAESALVVAETLAPALFLVTLFAGPAVVFDGGVATIAWGLGTWSGGVSLVGGAAAGAGLLVERRPLLRAVSLGLAAAALTTAAALLAVG